MLRHGQSLWNAKNLFTGWENIDLSEKGKEEAQKAGELISGQNIKFDKAWSSFLKRSQHTLKIILKTLPPPLPSVHYSWRLNERHYGRLQGRNKDEMGASHGPAQVFQWRRSFNIPPPPIPLESPKHPQHNPLYAKVEKTLLPGGESLKETMKRVLPLWEESIQPDLRAGKNILISAHGNSLRSLIKHIQKISDEDIPNFEIQTARPIQILWKNPHSIHLKPDIFKFLN